MQENGNGYFCLMERIGKPFCVGTSLEAISQGERVFAQAMKNFSDREFVSRGQIKTFLRENIEVREALENSKDIFGFFRICLNMAGQAKASWWKS